MASSTDHEVILDIEGMTCASCVNKVEKALAGVDDVETAVVNLANRTAIVRSETAPNVDRLVRAVTERRVRCVAARNRPGPRTTRPGSTSRDWRSP